MMIKTRPRYMRVRRPRLVRKIMRRWYVRFGRIWTPLTLAEREAEAVAAKAWR